VDSCGFGYGLLAGCGEYDNETSQFTKCGECLALTDCQLFKEDCAAWISVVIPVEFVPFSCIVGVILE
jgi:hypothetical protein